MNHIPKSYKTPKSIIDPMVLVNGATNFHWFIEAQGLTLF